MKELTIEEKAKAYDEIIKKANKMHHENCEACQACIEELIPELAESKDEMIIKAIKSAVLQLTDIYLQEKYGLKQSDCIAWLEKQGEKKPLGFNIGDEITVNGQICKVVAVEQKPAELSSEQKHTLQTDDVPNESSTAAPFRTGAIGFDGEPMESKPCEQKSAKWSEEDENYINDLIKYFSQNEKLENTKEDIVCWLKSIKDRYTWKPSEEQLNTLLDAIVYVEGCDSNFKGSGSVLENLYNDLQKLKDEK